jgi:OMF family outer membrane factor
MKLANIHKQFLVLFMLVAGPQYVQARIWTLQQCIDTAQVHNKQLKINRNNIAIGEGREKETKANLLPKVTANADYKYFTNLPYQLLPISALNPAAPEGEYRAAQFGVPNNINANLQLSMLLFNPQIYGAIQTTKIGSEISELHYQKTKEQIYFDITNLYYNAQILHHQLSFIDSNLNNANRLLHIMQLLNQQLLAKGTDVSKVKLQLAQLRLQNESIQSKYKQVMNALKFAIGLPLDLNLQIEPDILYESRLDYSSLSAIELRIANAQSRLLSSELATLSKSRYLPSLNLFATYGTTGFGYTGKPNSFLNFYPIGFTGVQLSYPIFNGTVTKRKIGQKKLELQNNELQIGLINEQNVIQVENAKLQREISQETIETSSMQINLAQTIYEQTILQHKHGAASLTDVLLADNALRDAQQSYLSVIIDYLKSDLELKKLTGNLTSTN